MTTRWVWRSFNDLSKEELYDILALRQEVFMIEQRCFYNDLDYLDQKASHLLGLQNDKLAAYLRFFPKDIMYPGAQSFGRVLTAEFARKQGLGKQLIEQALRFRDTALPIVISAQLYLEPFYQSYGFQSMGEPYDDAGIMHIEMRRPSDNE